jgi:hypothetical protein
MKKRRLDPGVRREDDTMRTLVDESARSSFRRSASHSDDPIIIPATDFHSGDSRVVPAKGGINKSGWIPAYAGMTTLCVRSSAKAQLVIPATR